MSTTPKTLNQLSNVSSWAGTDRVIIFGDGYENDMALSDFVVALGAYIAANYAAVNIPYLDGSDKIPVALLPTGTVGTDRGTFDPTGPTPNLTDGSGVAGDRYDVVAAGSHDAGSGSITYAVGDVAKYDGSVYYKVPGVANIYNGSATQEQAAAAGGYFLEGDVNDRANARQPANGAYYDGTAKNDASNNAATDPGTGDLTIAALVTFPDSLSTTNTIAGTRTTTSGYLFYQRASGALGIMLQDTSGNAVASTDDGDSLVGRTAHVVAVIDRTADTLTRYVDGVALSSVDDCSAVTGTITNANGFHMGHRINDFYLNGGTIHSAVPFNRALTAAEVLKLYKRGNVPEVDDQWADNTTQTSGTLTVGQKYRIDTYVSSDDFTNVGAASNATGVKFVATGTTPTTYSNGSTLRTIGAVAAYLPENIESDGSIVDASSNELNTTATNVTPMRTKPQRTGTFTPTLLFGGANTGMDYSTQTGYWRKLDEKTVHIEGCITVDTTLGSSTGDATIGGLPFTAVSRSVDHAVANIAALGMSGLTVGGVQGVVTQNNTNIKLYELTTSGLVTFNQTKCTTSTAIRFSATYEIA